MSERPTGEHEIVAAVLDAAARLFEHEDPGSVSLRRIATEANVNYGLVHRHLGTKNDLVAATIRRHSQRFLPSPAAEADPRERLAEMIRHYLGEPTIARTLAWAAMNDIDPHTLVDDLGDVHALVDALVDVVGSSDRARLVFGFIASATLGASLFQDTVLVAGGADPAAAGPQLADVVLEMLEVVLDAAPDLGTDGRNS